MKKENISQIISNIDEKYTDEATMFAFDSKQETADQQSSIENKLSMPTRRIRWGVLAACLAVLIVIGSTITAFAIEAKEYNTALSFFDENGLSTEGLSRSEVKAVYRDITTQSFTFGKTAQVLKQAVPGWEIEQDEPTPDELAIIWHRSVVMRWISDTSNNGIDFRMNKQYGVDEELGYEVFEKCILECYQDGNMLWSTEFTDFYVSGYSYIKDLTLVWGRNEIYTVDNDLYGFVAIVDKDGNILWQQRLNHDFKHEYVISILKHPDGTFAVISRGDSNYICLSYFDEIGKELCVHKTEIGDYGIWNVAMLGNGYIVQLGNQFSKDTALLVKMDREGNITESFSYKADDCDYYITDMVEFEGHVYLSAYAVPNQNDEGGRHEIANVLDYAFSKGTDERLYITSEELTPVVRENYTAILLMCDPESGVPKTFHSVKGSLGKKLVVNENGNLEWTVERINTTFFSPYTSSFTIGGTSTVFKYTFDKTGNLTGQTDTGETVPFRK